MRYQNDLRYLLVSGRILFYSILFPTFNIVLDHVLIKTVHYVTTVGNPGIGTGDLNVHDLGLQVMQVC